MKKTINEQIEQMLERLMLLSPNQVEAFFLNEWNPFIESLPLESHKILAFEKLWKCQVDNLKLIAAHIPALADDAFDKIEPQLQDLVSVAQARLTGQKEKAAPAA